MHKLTAINTKRNNMYYVSGSSNGPFDYLRHARRDADLGKFAAKVANDKYCGHGIIVTSNGWHNDGSEQLIFVDSIEKLKLVREALDKYIQEAE